MNNKELFTSLIGYEKEIKLIAKIAKAYGVSEAIVLRSLMASAEDQTFHDAINHYSDSSVDVAA